MSNVRICVRIINRIHIEYVIFGSACFESSNVGRRSIID